MDLTQFRSKLVDSDDERAVPTGTGVGSVSWERVGNDN